PIVNQIIGHARIPCREVINSSSKDEKSPRLGRSYRPDLVQRSSRSRRDRFEAACNEGICEKGIRWNACVPRSTGDRSRRCPRLAGVVPPCQFSKECRKVARRPCCKTGNSWKERTCVSDPSRPLGFQSGQEARRPTGRVAREGACCLCDSPQWQSWAPMMT